MECKFCGAKFKTEKGFSKHKCKRSTLAGGSQATMARAFALFDFWYRYQAFSRKQKTFQDFLKSPYMELFIKTAELTERVHVGSPFDFVRWLSDNRVPSSVWTSDEAVKLYRDNYALTENASKQAIETLKRMAEWCDSRGVETAHFFSEVPPSELVNWVLSGRMSPWVLFIGNSTPAFSRMSEEQIEIVCGVASPEYWEKRIASDKASSDTVRKLIANA